MSSEERLFSHVANVTGYMNIIAGIIGSSERKRVLDIPAGSGKFSDMMRNMGHDVVSADINKEKDNFVYADMTMPLPFVDNEFDVVVCMEGVEHVVNPVSLIGELVRVCNCGGTVIISTPNIMNMFSRIKFLFTGIFYQFSPALQPPATTTEKIDRGHISPVSYCQLRYVLEYFGCTVNAIHGDKYKRKLLLPLYLPIIALGRLWTNKLFSSKKASKYSERNRELFSHLYSPALLFSRSLIVTAKKQPNE